MNVFARATWISLATAALCASLLLAIPPNRMDDWRDGVSSLFCVSIFAGIFNALVALARSPDALPVVPANKPRHGPARKGLKFTVWTLIIFAMACAVGTRLADDETLARLLLLLTFGLWFIAVFGGFAMWIWLAAVDRAVSPSTQNQDATGFES